MRTLVPLAAVLVLAASACSAAPPAGEGASTSSAWSTTPEAMAEALPLLRYLNAFDVITEGDLDAACSDTEGRMAAGGDMTLVRYGANTHALPDVPWVPGAGASCFAGGAFRMVHGSVGLGTRGVEGSSVTLHHYAVGNARAACAGAFADVSASAEGALGGAVTCGARGYPAASFADAMVRAADAFADAVAAAPPRAPLRRTSPAGIDERVFTPGTGPDAFFAVTTADLAAHWVLEPGARYFVALTGPGADGAVAFTPEHGVEGSAYALLVLPRATALHIGSVPDRQVRIALTVLAPRAATTFHYDILDGGLYVKSLDANPGHLPAAASSACAPGTWQPGHPLGRTQWTSGGQINHWPFTWSYPAGTFAQPLF